MKNFYNEKIAEANTASRPLQSSSGEKFGMLAGIPHHRGITGVTESGKKFTMHSTPEKGQVVTLTPPSKGWQKDYPPIAIQGDNKTVGGAMKASGADKSYLEGGTCIRTTHKAKEYLEKK